jgi:hypothetical protein
MLNWGIVNGIFSSFWVILGKEKVLLFQCLMNFSGFLEHEKEEYLRTNRINWLENLNNGLILLINPYLIGA